MWTSKCEGNTICTASSQSDYFFELGLSSQLTNVQHLQAVKEVRIDIISSSLWLFTKSSSNFSCGPKTRSEGKVQMTCRDYHGERELAEYTSSGLGMAWYASKWLTSCTHWNIFGMMKFTILWRLIGTILGCLVEISSGVDTRDTRNKLVVPLVPFGQGPGYKSRSFQKRACTPDLSFRWSNRDPPDSIQAIRVTFSAARRRKPAQIKDWCQTKAEAAYKFWLSNGQVVKMSVMLAVSAAAWGCLFDYVASRFFSAENIWNTQMSSHA